MRSNWTLAFAAAAAFMALVPVARADVCGDNRSTCSDPFPECWFNPSRSEYACSARGLNHCGSAYRSYSCTPPSNCLGDGSAPPYCSTPSRFLAPHRRPGVTPINFPYLPATKK